MLLLPILDDTLEEKEIPLVVPPAATAATGLSVRARVRVRLEAVLFEAEAVIKWDTGSNRSTRGSTWASSAVVIPSTRAASDDSPRDDTLRAKAGCTAAEADCMAEAEAWVCWACWACACWAASIWLMPGTRKAPGWLR